MKPDPLPESTRYWALSGLFVGVANLAAEFFFRTDVAFRHGFDAAPQLYPPLRIGLFLAMLCALLALGLGKLIARNPDYGTRPGWMRARSAVIGILVFLSAAATPFLLSGLLFLGRGGP